MLGPERPGLKAPARYNQRCARLRSLIVERGPILTLRPAVVTLMCVAIVGRQRYHHCDPQKRRRKADADS